MWERKCIHFRSDIQYDHQFESVLNKYPDYKLVSVVPMEAGKFKFMAFMEREKRTEGFAAGGIVKGKDVKK